MRQQLAARGCMHAVTATYSMLIVIAVADSVTVRHIIWQMINADMVAYYHLRLFWLTSQTHGSL